MRDRACRSLIDEQRGADLDHEPARVREPLRVVRLGAVGALRCVRGGGHGGAPRPRLATALRGRAAHTAIAPLRTTVTTSVMPATRFKNRSISWLPPTTSTV